MAITLLRLASRLCSYLGGAGSGSRHWLRYS